MNNDEYYKVLLENIDAKDFAGKMYITERNNGGNSEREVLSGIEYILDSINNNSGGAIRKFNSNVLENCFRIAFKSMFPNFNKELENKIINLTMGTKIPWVGYTDKFFDIVDIVKQLH